MAIGLGGAPPVAPALPQPHEDPGWSQPEPARRIGASGAVAGRYQRGERMPSIEVAQKMAEVFGVTVDDLLGEQEVPNLLSQSDSDRVEHPATLDSLPADDRGRILHMVDWLIREARTRHAFGAAR